MDNPKNEAVVPRRSTRILKSVVRNDYVSYLAMGNLATDPMTIEKAFDQPDRQSWLKAIEEEKKSFIENETWELSAPPEDSRILNTMWIFRTKKNASSEIVRHKARLVVRGCVSRQKGLTIKRRIHQ